MYRSFGCPISCRQMAEVTGVCLFFENLAEMSKWNNRVRHPEHIEHLIDSGHHQMFSDSLLSNGEDFDLVVREVLALHLGLTFEDVSGTNGTDFKVESINDETSEVVIVYEPFQTELNDTRIIETAIIRCVGTVTEGSDIKIKEISVVSWEE